MKIKQLQMLLIKRYKINAAMAMETASALMKDGFWNFSNMDEKEVNEILTMIEKNSEK